MAWDDDMVTMLRVLVNDIDSTTYTDDKLIQTILVAAFQVKQEATFPYEYTVSLSNQTISPDPTVAATSDESFYNLTCLKAAAITDRGSAILAARRAISVRDGSSAIDLRGPLAGWLALLKTGWNAVYEAAKNDYLLSGATIAGAMVLSPFRTYMSANYDGRGVYLFGDSRTPNNPEVY